MIGRTSLFARNVLQQFVRQSHGGVPGEVGKSSVKFVIHTLHNQNLFQNLPFSIKNRYRLTALFIVFFGSGIGAPYFVLRHQLLKK